MKLDELKDKNILILGFGREGRDSLKFLRRLFPNKILGIADRLKVKDLRLKINDRKVKLHLGNNYLRALQDYDLIIKSPGVPFKILPKSALEKITTQTEIFFEKCPGKIVGIAGTKGKSTTTSLIYKILKEELKVHPLKFASQTFKRVNLVGNIGKPVLSLLFSAKPNDIYVYELSSHQLYNLKKSPQITVFLNIYPDHLDYYRSFKEYAKAEANITRYQTKNDYLIFNSEDKLVRELAKKSKAKKIAFSSKMSFEFLSTWKKSQMKGNFNLLNTRAAVMVGKIFGISNRKMAEAIKNFKPLPHRLELVGTFKGITFYNDALSVIPETTIAALDSLGKKVQTIILGGFDRGLDFKNLAKRILKSKIKNLILFPTTGKKIWQTIQHVSLSRKNYAMTLKLQKHFLANNMPGAVKLAYQYTQRGKICLLSTASASFSLFRDYKEKGNLFKKYVKKYGQN